MDPNAKKIRDTYAVTPNAPFVMREFGYYCIEKWEQDIPREQLAEKMELACLEKTGRHNLGELGWCEAGFCPEFPEEVLEDRGEHEVVQDSAGRSVLCFKNRRSGFMPTYLDHPVKDMATFRDKCLWRLDPNTPERYADFEGRMGKAMEAEARGDFMTQSIIGGYMYLRSLMGPEGALYQFYDDPELIHACMRSWFDLADAVVAKHQEYVTLDEVFFAEDICYNHGSLISPAMIKEFLFPYYKKLLDNCRKRQLDKTRRMYFQVDTDGYCENVIDLYMEELGMDAMSPFEAAAGNDLLAVARRYPNLAMFGGVDKRVLARGKDAIDKLADSIFPEMHKRGGYTPTCDHGVPAEVSFDNWLHFRKRCLEYA